MNKPSFYIYQLFNIFDNMNLRSLLKERKSDFISLCQKHQVNKIYAFGSSVTERFDPAHSDIDIIVELDIQDPIEHGGNLLSLWDSLEVLFNRKVDLLTDDSINNHYPKKKY